jgi:YidC/Oxa1 family membrane protein insertase
MRFFRELAAYSKILELPPKQTDVVFYSEGPGDWPHLEGIVRELVQTYRQPILYLASAADDPGLRMESEFLTRFCVGAGAARTLLFRRLRASVMAMTMPDLGIYHLKRSLHQVHYVYIFHALNSAHMIYPQHSFDHYDTILCIGPHHVEELRQLERLNSIPPRNLVPHGYGRLDRLIRSSPSIRRAQDGDRLNVLVAPSWGRSSITETCGEELVQILLGAGHSVTFRPHPMTKRMGQKHIQSLTRRFGSHPCFRLDEDAAGDQSLEDAQVLVTDWSGIAFEFAFAFGKPVLFVDLPPKIRNLRYADMSLVSLEVRIREELGAVLPLERLSDAASVLSRATANLEQTQSRSARLRQKWIYNIGTSGSAGAQAIYKLAERRVDKVPAPTSLPTR